MYNRRGQKNSLYYNYSKQYWFPNFTTQLALHQWVHYCHVFSSGEYRAFVDGEERVQGSLVTQVLPLPLNSSLILGQEQDLVGGGFDITQIFHGYIAQVNIWNKSLTQKEVEDMSACRHYDVGNVFSTDMDELEVFGAVLVETVQLHTFCEKTVKFVIFPEPRDLETSKLMCQRVGHVIYGPGTVKENTNLHNVSLQFVHTCAANYHLWIGLTDEKEEGTWRKISDNETVEELSFDTGQPNGKTDENCLYMAQGSGLWLDVYCHTDWLACVPCTKQHDSPLRLRGLCLRRKEETYYEVLGYRNSKPYFHGFYGFMLYTVGDGEWLLKDIKKSTLVASLKLTSTNSYPIGRNTWSLNSSVCTMSSGTELELSLSACDDNEFTCANGDCIPKERRCDLNYDCSDFTDERKCNLVLMPESYQAERPPDTMMTGEAVQLASVIQILRFMKIDDISRTIRLEMIADIMWKDARLKYLNLKDIMERNRLSAQEASGVWRPLLEFPTLYDGNIKLHQEATYLTKTGRPLPRDFNDVKMDTVYSGDSATLMQKQHYIGTFACPFDMFYYPFDTQRCSVLLQLSLVTLEVVAFIEDGARVEYLGDKELPSYIIAKKQVTVIQRGNNHTRHSVLSVELELRRRWTVIVLSVYLPTTMLLVIGYSTLFVRVDLLQVRLNVSLTTLLVLYTLSNTTSDALPITAYVKLIDVWFLYCISLLFFVILCHVVVEYLQANFSVIKVRPVYAPPKFTPHSILRFTRAVVVPVVVVSRMKV
ncbi:Glutamate-gated chloride channel-like 5 [Homarus americanus]|uniref:Glutamate-gated chloride channel-like 5 n=1 Tax=Homarus americanus TaxID=6706 RepID=A0A8J5N9I8_HOMAM|nr:Glutamate-gated chloride channel-like 5 [Homarus americanus]